MLQKISRSVAELSYCYVYLKTLYTSYCCVYFKTKESAHQQEWKKFLQSEVLNSFPDAFNNQMTDHNLQVSRFCAHSLCIRLSSKWNFCIVDDIAIIQSVTDISFLKSFLPSSGTSKNPMYLPFPRCHLEQVFFVLMPPPGRPKNNVCPTLFLSKRDLN